MNSNRIEILKDGVWVALKLRDFGSVKYNARVNKVGDPSTREISSSNTFGLPYTKNNIQALGINVFNPLDNAKALNRRYDAKYYVNDSLIRTGYLLINNTRGGIINVNFIDEAFDIVSKWGSITYQELLQNTSLPIEADYATAIDELRNYSAPIDNVLLQLPAVGTRGYNLCLFPNNLNAVGEKFQKDVNDLRQDDVFNPYQSRPIFNAMSVFDLAVERYGYTADYDASVDWSAVQDIYMIASQSDGGEEGENGFVTETYDSIFLSSPYYQNQSGLDWDVRNAMKFPGSISLKPQDINNWDYATATTEMTQSNIGSTDSVFTPVVDTGNVGSFRFTASISEFGDTTEFGILVYWYNSNQTSPPIYDYYTTEAALPAQITQGVDFDLDFTFDKTLFDTPPAGTNGLIGVMCYVYQTKNTFGTFFPNLTNMQVTETFIPVGVIAFDDYQQYLPTTLDFSVLSSRKTVKELLASLMSQQGILMDINTDTKVIKFFTYGQYDTQRNNSNFYVFDDYIQKYEEFVWKTDYGNNYGKLTKIGLNTPYKGNEYIYELENQGEDSRYKDLATDYSKIFKDVTQVFDIDNTNFPYFEYTNKGEGLIEYFKDEGPFTQQRADGTSQGTITISLVNNINYAEIPAGVSQWYKQVDEAVRVEAMFLIPEDVFKSLDLSYPIYIGELGGFYIIEEITEYVNGRTPVKLKLIKLLEDLGV
jgi:hypothetical protein